MSVYVDDREYEDGVTEDFWPDGARFSEHDDGSMNLLDADGEEFAFWNWYDDQPDCTFLVELYGSPLTDADGVVGMEYYRLPEDASRLKSVCADVFSKSKEC